MTRLVCICVCICMYIQKLLLNPHQSKSDTSSIMYWSYYNILTPSCMRTYSRKHKQSAILLYIEDKNTSRYTFVLHEKHDSALDPLYLPFARCSLSLSLFLSLFVTLLIFFLKSYVDTSSFFIFYFYFIIVYLDLNFNIFSFLTSKSLFLLFMLWSLKAKIRVW